jgi:hypothetical protein
MIVMAAATPPVPGRIIHVAAARKTLGKQSATAISIASLLTDLDRSG